MLVVALSLLAPLAALADGGGGNQSKPSLVTARPGAAMGRTHGGGFVAPELLKLAQTDPNQSLRLIIQASAGFGAAASAFAANGQADGGTVTKRLALVNGVAVNVKAKWIMRLARISGLDITADSKVETTGMGNGKYNAQLWPYVSGNARLWGSR